MFKKLICGILIGVSLMCGVGCNQQNTETSEVNQVQVQFEEKCANEIRTELFASSHVDVEINNWLKNHPNVYIIDIKFSAYSQNGVAMVLIIYRNSEVIE